MLRQTAFPAEYYFYVFRHKQITIFDKCETVRTTKIGKSLIYVLELHGNNDPPIRH